MLELTSWKQVHDYDTSYDCEKARREEIKGFVEREHVAAMHAEDRYRCERVEHVRRRKDIGTTVGREPGR